MDISINLTEEADGVEVYDSARSFDDTTIQLGGLELTLNWEQVQNLVRALAPYFEPECLADWATPHGDAAKGETPPIR